MNDFWGVVGHQLVEGKYSKYVPQKYKDLVSKVKKLIIGYGNPGVVHVDLCPFAFKVNVKDLPGNVSSCLFVNCEGS